MLQNYKKVVVVCGGYNEVEISMNTGRRVYKSLLESGKYNVIMYVLDSNTEKFIRFMLDNKDGTVVFVALHGSPGEDGTLSSTLNMLEIPYTHCGREAGTVCMNKSLSKMIASKANIPVLEEQICHINDLISLPIAFPAFIKPINGGSSFGNAILKEQKDVDRYYKQYKDKKIQVIIEPYIVGKEYTVSVLQGRSLEVTEIVSHMGEFYNVESKYVSGGATRITPADVSAKDRGNMLMWAERFAKVAKVKDLCRIDYKSDDRGGIYFIECNTHPGLSAISLTCYQLEYAGIPFLAFCEMLIDNAAYEKEICS